MSNAFTWLTDSANWHDQLGAQGIPTQILNHVEYSAIAVGVAAAIALPIGVVIGHSGRGSWFVAFVNGLRALPTVGLLILFYVLLSPHIHGRGNAVYLIPTEAVLILLAVPPMLANSYAGVQNVDPAARDAARGMGMTAGQILVRVEVPNALPLILSGARSATLQVIATATVAAYVGLGGLGRFVYDGLAQHDFAQMTGGSVLVAALALAVDLVLSLLQRYAVSAGVSGRFSRTAVGADARVGALVEAEVAPV